MIIQIQYGIGYGTHDAELDLPDDASTDDIEDEVGDYVRERMWFTWDKAEEE